jgi:predicted 2-oxoglutarate/Fe(II)-dependent dioxygenase YbiX
MVIFRKNFFTKEEVDDMLLELQFLCQDEFLVDSSKAGGAVLDGKLLRNSKGLLIESVMSAESSTVIKTMNKIYDKEFIDSFIEETDFYEFLKMNTVQTNLINHYMDKQEYGLHKDRCVITAITVFHRTPKPYSGGQLEVGGKVYDPEPGDIIIFPSYKLHGVYPIKMNVETNDNMNGRISVSKFIKVG